MKRNKHRCKYFLDLLIDQVTKTKFESREVEVRRIIDNSLVESIPYDESLSANKRLKKLKRKYKIKW